MNIGGIDAWVNDFPFFADSRSLDRSTEKKLRINCSTPLEYEYGRYKGEWVGGFPDGQGQFVSSRSNTYTGQFYKGFPYGQCELDIPGGWNFKGNFRDGHIDGYGVKTFPDGSSEEGCFKSDKLDGIGRVRDKMKQTLKYGEWVYGK